MTPATGNPAGGFAAGRLRWLAAALAAAALVAVIVAKFPVRRADRVAAVLLVAVPSEGDPQRDSGYRQTQVSLIKTRPVLEAAFREPRVAELSLVREHQAPVAWLEQALVVEAPDGQSTIRISLPSERPAESAVLVNAVAGAYLREVVAPERDQRRKQLADCERAYREQLAAIDAKLADAEAVCRRGEKESRADVLQRLGRDGSGGVRKELDDVTGKLERAKQDLALLEKKGPDDRVPDALVDEQLDKEPAYARLQAQRDKLKRTIAAYEKYARSGPDGSPFVASSLKAYRADLRDTERQLDERRRAVRGQLGDEWRQSHAEAAKQTRKQLEDQIARLSDEQNRLRGRLAEQLREAEKLSGNAWADVDRLLKEIGRRQGIVKALGSQCEKLRRDLEQAPRVWLAQEASLSND